MAKEDELAISQEQLVDSWDQMLPTYLLEGDSYKVWPDAKDPSALRVHINVAGRSKYSFDFKCTYVDSREVKVDMVDVEQDNVAVDDRLDNVQKIAKDYVQSLHECAQALHPVTKGGLLQ